MFALKAHISKILDLILRSENRSEMGLKSLKTKACVWIMWNLSSSDLIFAFADLIFAFVKKTQEACRCSSQFTPTLDVCRCSLYQTQFHVLTSRTERYSWPS